MLFQTNPDTRPHLWQGFSDKVLSKKISSIVSEGTLIIEDNRFSSNQVPDEIINRFRSADIVRFGSSGNQAIGPFFALTMQANSAKLVEYAIDSEARLNSDSNIKEDLQLLLIDILFSEKNITNLLIPFKTPELSVDGFSVAYSGEQTIAIRTEKP